MVGRAGLPRAPALAASRCLRQCQNVPDVLVENNFAGSVIQLLDLSIVTIDWKFEQGSSKEWWVVLDSNQRPID